MIPELLRFARLRRSWAASIVVVNAAVTAMGADPAIPLVVGVRSSVQVRAEQNEVYFIRSVQQISGMEKIQPPADVEALLGLVRQQLNAAGFRPIAPGLRPDIVLTVEYGRDWLENPYLAGTGAINAGTSSAVPATGGGLGLSHTPQQNVTGTTVQLLNQIGPGMEARLQKAQYEKLYLKITAWQYQADPQARMRRLWIATMVVDDPNLDLNAVAATMLAAGVPYFGQPLEEAEVEVRQPMPAGHVVVGRPQVVDAPTPPVPAVPVATAAVASPHHPEIPKNFDLPAANAAATLQEFSHQSGEEIIFPVEPVRTVQLPALRGEMTTSVALARLLDGSGLVAIQDEKTGAWVVRPVAK